MYRDEHDILGAWKGNLSHINSFIRATPQGRLGNILSCGRKWGLRGGKAMVVVDEADEQAAYDIATAVLRFKARSNIIRVQY